METADRSQANFKMDARREIHQHGLEADDLLASDPDAPVFGFNLACAYPFPASAAQSYRAIAQRLRALEPAVYVYPEWQTHVTIVTFISFRPHRRIAPEPLAQLRALIHPVHDLIRPLLKLPKFEFVAGPPVLTRKAAILPISDAAGAVARIRQNISEALAANNALRGDLERGGLNVPGIIHSTIMRFKSQPADLSRFLADFDAASNHPPFPLKIDELLLTTETKPYMREGEIVHRFPLA